ncbi:MAG TPA: hypothetical protein VGN88_04455 [Phycisphaerae bacterium]|jgi:flagellar motility protein MotE (MotC chaperone)
MKKIGTFISLLCIINVLMIAGLAGYLFGTGRLDKSKAQTISDMLRQPNTPDGLRAKVYDIMVPATRAAATGTAPAPAGSLAAATGEEPAAAQDRINYVQKVLEEERIKLDNQAQEQRHQQDLLAKQQAELEKQWADLKKDKEAFDAKVLAASGKKDDAGFQKTMAMIQEAKPKQAKDLMASMPADEIAKYLTTMDPDRAVKVIAEFKTPEEKSLINSVLEKVRGNSEAAGTGAASASPAGTQGLPSLAAPSRANP